MMYYGIVEGEIIRVQPQKKNQGSKIFYVCEVYLPDGHFVQLPNCQQSSQFGGIGDYYRRRARGRDDAEFANGIDELKQNNRMASVGERVFISFLNGSLTTPIIMGYAQHPNQTSESTDTLGSSIPDPQLVHQYNGLRTVIDDSGQYRITRQGAPTVSFSPDSPDNAIAFSDSLSSFEMLAGGVIKIRDGGGGVISMDGNIKISNNNGAVPSPSLSNETIAGLADGTLDFDAVSDANSSEFILISYGDKSIEIGARDYIKIQSFGDRLDHTHGNHLIITDSSTTEIDGAFEERIGGDHLHYCEGQTSSISDGDHSITVNADFFLTAQSKIDISSGNDMILNSSANMALDASGSFTVSAGTISISNKGAELLDLFDQTIDQIDQSLQDIQLLTVTGNLGYPSSVPINAASFAAIQASLAAIKALLNSMMG